MTEGMPEGADKNKLRPLGKAFSRILVYYAKGAHAFAQAALSYFTTSAVNCSSTIVSP
jgi:hypothetical protein